MQNTVRRLNTESDETQFAVIRDLMLDASKRGDWLTLAEIAESTEFGEASISAQLRHMRKVRFGNYRVDKRRRELLVPTTTHTRGDGVSDASVAEATANSTTGATAIASTDCSEENSPAQWMGIGCRSGHWESRRPDAHGNLSPWEYRASLRPQFSGELIFES